MVSEGEITALHVRHAFPHTNPTQLHFKKHLWSQKMCFCVFSEVRKMTHHLKEGYSAQPLFSFQAPFLNPIQQRPPELFLFLFFVATPG